MMTRISYSEHELLSFGISEFFSQHFEILTFEMRAFVPFCRNGKQKMIKYLNKALLNYNIFESFERMKRCDKMDSLKSNNSLEYRFFRRRMRFESMRRKFQEKFLWYRRANLK